MRANAKFSTSPAEIIRSLWRNRELIRASVIREIAGRYRGSFIGAAWPFLTPFLMLAVYTFVFSEVFKVHWRPEGDSKIEFALVLFIGLIIFNIFSECINRAPTLVISNQNYVKKVIFPLEILPIITLISSSFHGLASLLVWLLAYLFFFGVPHGTIIYLPLIIFPFLMLLIGVSWILSSLGVFLRDISQITGIFTAALMFLSPIFLPISAIPINYRSFFYLNPLTPVVEQTRDVMFWGKAPDFELLISYWAVTFCIACIGFFCFQKARIGFSDVL